MSRSKLNMILTLTLLFTLLISPLASAQALDASSVTAQSASSSGTTSPRLIVELASPPLAAVFANKLSAASVNGKLDVDSTAAQEYINQLQAEQAAFVSNMQTALADATVASFINEAGMAEQATYQVVFNGLSIDPGSTSQAQAMRRLSMLPGVKHVYVDQMYQTNLYTSTSLINAPTLWNTVGGRSNGGAGIKIASIDGGVHHQAAMMDGTGYSYPAGYGPNGLGLTANNNGKIIVSRAYFRPWDPPAAGDENAWPGKNGTSHGMHTSSTAAGGIVNATTNGFNVGQMSGVAPKAYVMSYRVFYYSVNEIGSFYATEGLAALEDMVRDGADVVNNSWGGGPTSSGGPFDPIDAALQNAAKAGVFVTMSNGNSGPNTGTSDHPSSDYINVAASTSGGTIAEGLVIVPNAAPNLQQIAYSSAQFGTVLPLTPTATLPYLPAGVVDVTNIEGCNAWPANTFSGKVALIRRGNCDFSRKAYHAQTAGAAMVIIYNHSIGGDALISMSAGEFAGQVALSSVFIGNTNGEAMVSYYNTAGAGSATVRIDPTASYQAGNKADQIASFSSRGPGVGGTLKPDIAAPGVNILAQGYTLNTDGEARHLGYGQASGTSMAAPHVAGAAALLQQLHPDWSPAWIKSALMSTAKYRDIYLSDGVTPAQPLDMGSGRLNLAKAGDPGVILDPPSLSFGFIYTGTQRTIQVTVTSVASATETYNLSTLYTGGGFTNTKALPGYSVTPASLTLNPGQVKSFQVTFNPAASQGIGDNQGYVLLDGTQHKAHLAAWARVLPSPLLADVLIIDNDFSDYDYLFNLGLDNYIDYYTQTLDDLGYTYSVLNYDFEELPDAATLAGYRAILYYTGDNFVSQAGLLPADQDKLVEYLSGGGSLIAMGQDLAATLGADETDLGAPFLYSYNLSANWITDSVSSNETPLQIIQPTSSAAQFLQNVRVDLTKSSKYSASDELLGKNERPISVTTGTTGFFSIYHNQDLHRTEFFVTVVPTVTTPITVTGAHIHVGDANSAGPVVREIFATAGFTQPVVVTDGLVLEGIVTPPLSDAEAAQMLDGKFYINVHTTANPGGEIRGQIQPVVVPSEKYVDEIDNHYHDGSEDPNGIDGFQGAPLLFYPGPSNIYSGTVTMGYRQQPSLETPGISYAGRSIYATFGLEGVSESFNSSASITPTSRSELLGKFLDWVWAQPPTSVNVTNTVGSGLSYTFSAQPIYGLQQTRNDAVFTPSIAQVRWDFGDGTVYTVTSGIQINHTYQCSFNNVHTIRAEVTDNYGTAAIGSQTLDLSSSCAGTKSLFLPLISK